MALTLLGRRLLTRSRLQYSPKRHGYIVLIPEVPGEFSEEIPSDILPDFNNITTEICIGTVSKYLLDFETGIWKLSDEIEKNKTQPENIFKDILNPIEELSIPLDTHWAISKLLYLTNSKLMPAKPYINIHTKARRARTAKFHSTPIFKKCKAFDSSTLEEEEKRVIDKFILEGKLNGLELEDYTRNQLLDAVTKLGHFKTRFRGKVDVSTARYKQVIKDSTLIEKVPTQLLQSINQIKKLAASKNVKESKLVPSTSSTTIATLHPEVQNAILEYCPNADIRYNLWAAKVARCSFNDDRHLRSSCDLEEIRFWRREQAEKLGYETYADMSMETKMAKSVSHIRDVIDDLLEDAFTAQVLELQYLQEFASQRGHRGSLAPWDIPFWSRQSLIHEMDGMTEDNIREYFPLPRVFTHLVNLTNRLFGLKIEEQTDVVGWHPDVRFFTITEPNEDNPFAGFYFDPYSRDTKPLTGSMGTMLGLRNRFNDTRALAALVFHFPPPEGNKPSLLSFQEVRILFAKFGLALQHTLSKTKFTEVAGLSNVEWDALGICSNFMMNWSTDKETLSEMAVHYKTEEALSPQVVEKLCSWDKHMAGHSLCKELYLSTLDLDLYTRKDFWLENVRRLWPSFHSYDLHPKDWHPCSFTAIFSDEWAAGYYSHFWSQMIGADVYNAFSEAGSDPRAIADVGHRFGQTFLSSGGAVHPSTVFRRFRGRDPTTKAYLERLGINQTSLEIEM